MKLPLLLFLLLSFCLTPLAQVNYSNDSIRVVNAEWSIDTLEGFYLKRYQFGEGALFCSAQYLCILEIPARSHRWLAFAHDTTPTVLSTLAQRYSAYAAVNGSFDGLTGDYFTTVRSGDIFDTSLFEKCINLMQKHDCSVAFGSKRFEYETISANDKLSSDRNKLMKFIIQ